MALRFEPADGSSAEPQVLLVNQERPAIKKKTWEIPAGLVEAYERDNPQLTAGRELREETGYVADRWQRLVREYPSPGFSTEAITIYLAMQVHPATDRSSAPDDPTELDSVRWLPLREALVLCQNGEVEDGKTLLGLCLVHSMLSSTETSLGEHTMPLDATNIPFPRSAPFQKSNNAETQAGMNNNLNGTLNIENMLLEEFNYASLAAYQAMEDRARISSLYYLLLGALASGLLAIYQSGGSAHTYSQPLVVALLFVAGLFSITFFEKIIRLRQAYRESLICMNVIKEFYIKQFKRSMPQIEQAFRWRLRTIPSGGSFKNVTFAISALIALAGSICFAGAVLVGIQPGVIADPGIGGALPYLVFVVVFFTVLSVYFSYYRYSLSKRKEDEVIQKQVQKMGIEH